MISSTSTTSTSGVMLISDCRLEPESLLLNCMMSLSFCARALGDQPHPAEAFPFDRNHDLPNLAEIELCIAPDNDLGVRLGTHGSAESLVEMLGCDGLVVDPQSPSLVYGDQDSASLVALRVRFRRVRHFDVRPLELWYFEQAVHELGRSPIHFDMESLNLAREVVKGDDGRNCDEDTHRRRDQGLSDAARNHRHSAGPCGRDAPESVDDSDHSAEKTNERGRGADCGKEPETTLQLNQRFGNRVPECASDELERSGRVASSLPHAVVLDDARRDHLCDVGIRVQPPGFDQILDITPVKELLELGLELFRLTRG